jgi:hypothetical protein
MSPVIKHTLRFILLIATQVYVLDNVHLHHLITPYLYLVFVLWLPFQTGRSSLMLLAFVTGLTLDAFRHSPGFHAAAAVLVAYVRPFLIGILIPQEGADTNYDEPSVKSLGGFIPYLVYIGVLCFLHHGWLFLLQAWQFGDAWYFLVKTCLSTGLSMGLILLVDVLFQRKQTFRTNTA